jgi:hypothetical protein
MEKRLSEIKAASLIIKNETVPEANTALRVGGNFEDIADSVEERRKTFLYTDTSGNINNVAPFITGKTLFITFNAMDGDTVFHFQGEVEDGDYFQLFVHRPNGYKLRLQSNFVIPDNDDFPFLVTAVGSGYVEFQLPATTIPEKYIVFSCSFQNGVWILNANIYKIPTV